MPTDPEPPPALRAGRRALEGLPGVDLLGDLWWDKDGHKWVLPCRLDPGIPPTDFLSPVTDWHMLIDPSYPWGTVKLYPDKERGPKSTFPHQLHNGPGDANKPWRTGDMCVSTPLHILGRQGLDIEPYDAHQRLRWRLERALEWLVAASRGNLVRNGDPFELPDLPVSTEMRFRVAFTEGPDIYSHWHSVSDVVGLVELFDTAVAQDYLIVRSFLSSRGKILLESEWGNALVRTPGNKYTGLWIRLDSPPLLEPWQAPTNWRELRQAFYSQGADLDERMRISVRAIRDGRPHFILIGFPVTETVGAPPVQMHWQGMLLPVLSWGTQTAKGFRPNETGHWRRDRMELLKDETPLHWVPSENWHHNQLTNRGSMPNHIKTSHILIIGAGALGSSVAELLIRAGVQNLMVIDDETLEAGNLVRHNLLLTDVRKSKANQLAIRLNSVSPNARVEAINAKFPPGDVKATQQIQHASIVIDCTASDDVFNAMEYFEWSGEKLFVSLSLGMKARRLYCFTARGTTVSHAKFRDLIRPWLLKEAEENKGLILPREGLGCWHPVFPARADDISLMAATAIKLIEEMALKSIIEPTLSVFESCSADDSFSGIIRVQG